MNYKDLLKAKNINLVGAVSGGLDSCTITHWLAEKSFKLKCVTVDLGQPDEENIITRDITAHNFTVFKSKYKKPDIKGERRSFSLNIVYQNVKEDRNKNQS